ncbi:hypothetical protein HYU19_04195 [Candidatus Woesearchaeota archaeon]|nr:hypothetical protein [Candidatus Woesearchaeota archaeon]
MIFNDSSGYDYGNALDREYSGNSSPEFVSGYGGTDLSQPIGEPWGDTALAKMEVKAEFGHGANPSEPILTTKQLGQTISEGRGLGTFVESLPAAIRTGANVVELSLNSGEFGTGPDYYTKEKLQEIRDIARANQIELASVHTPVQVVGNMSGFDHRSGFSDETRHIQLNEVRKAIQFNAETAQGGAVVIHTGEFQRTMFDKPWGKGIREGEYQFKAYEEEPERFVAYIVDDRTGQIINTVKKTQVVYEPVYQTAKDLNMIGQRDAKTGHVFQEEDLVGVDKQWINPKKIDQLFERVPIWDTEKTQFKVKKLEWDEFMSRAEKWNRTHADEIARDPTLRKLPEEMFIQTQMENRELQARGSSLFHGKYYEMHREERDALKEALDYYENLDKHLPEDQKWQMLRTHYPVRHLPDMVKGKEEDVRSILKREIKRQTDEMRYTHEATAAADAQAAQTREDMAHMIGVEKYAKEQSAKSYAEAAIYAYDMTKSKGFQKAIFVSPENIFPEHGYGSHPEELRDMVYDSRKKMVQHLIHERGFQEDKAKKIAEQHIKATLDTEHLGLWKKHYVRNEGETEDEFEKRFNGWYMDQVKMLDKAGIIGHIHIADGFGYGHANLPPGAGNLPVVEAVNYLKSKGYQGAFLSEGYGDAPRILTQAWKAFGSPIYSAIGPIRPAAPLGTRFNDVQYGYFGRNFPPNYIFGAYSPSNEWTLWSQTPME